jgi:hypothetical protein
MSGSDGREICHEKAKKDNKENPKNSDSIQDDNRTEDDDSNHWLGLSKLKQQQH